MSENTSPSGSLLPEAHIWKGNSEDLAAPTSSFSISHQRTCPCPTPQELTSSFVVWLELIRYVWKPESPTMDQTAPSGPSRLSQSTELSSLCCAADYQSDQIRSVAQSCPTLCDPCIAAHQASLSITNSRSSFRLTSIESVMPSSHLILCRPLLLLPPIPPSISLFQ